MGDCLGHAVAVDMGLDIDAAKRRRESAESVQPRHGRGKLPSPPGGSSLFGCPSQAELRQVAQPTLVGGSKSRPVPPADHIPASTKIVILKPIEIKASKAMRSVKVALLS